VNVDYSTGNGRNCDYLYLRQAGYVITVVCLSVFLLVTLWKNFGMDLHEIFREGWQWASKQMTKFWWCPDHRSGAQH